MSTGVAPFDFPWTLVHVGVGVAAGALKMSPWLYGALILGYEVLENREGGAVRKSIFSASGPESLLNSVADVAVGLLGYVGARYLLEGVKT